MNAFLSLLQKLLLGGFLLMVVSLVATGIVRRLLPENGHAVEMSWHRVKNENTVEAYLDYLRECPACADARQAAEALDKLQRPSGLIARLDREHVSTREELVATTFSPDGNTLAAAGTDRLHFWDAATGHPQQPVSREAFELLKERRIASLRYSLGGKRIAAGTANKGGGNLMIWDAETGKLIADHALEGYDIKTVAFAPKNVGLGWLADGPLGIWQPENGKLMRATHEGATALSFMRDESDTLRLITASGREVWLWDPATLEPLQKSELKTEKDLLGLSRDGKFILYQDRHGLEVWNPVSGTLLATLDPMEGKVSAFCRDPRKGWLVLGTTSGMLYLWDLSPVQRLGEVLAHRDSIEELVCSSKGRIASKGLDSTRIWDIDKMRKAALHPSEGSGVRD